MLKYYCIIIIYLILFCSWNVFLLDNKCNIITLFFFATITTATLPVNTKVHIFSLLITTPTACTFLNATSTSPIYNANKLDWLGTSVLIPFLFKVFIHFLIYFHLILCFLLWCDQRYFDIMTRSSYSLAEIFNNAHFKQGCKTVKTIKPHKGNGRQVA